MYIINLVPIYDPEANQITRIRAHKMNNSHIFDVKKMKKRSTNE